LRIVSEWLYGDQVLERLAVLWTICALLFTASWTTSYHLLPEGVLRGKLLGQYIPVETPRVITTLLRVFGVNLLAGCGLVALANLCQAGRTPLGYPIVMYHAILYGILLGTNSFGISAPARLAPSLKTVLNRSGAFEITAYIAVAVATRGLVIWRQPSWLNCRQTEQVGSWRKWWLNRAEIAVIVGAILLLAAANCREAFQIQQAAPG
jgi:hypothetical protein